MALVLTHAFETRWRAESPLRPPRGRDPATRSGCTGAATFATGPRAEIDSTSKWFHLFSIAQFARGLRGEREYAEQGRNAITLLKTEEMSVVLEVAAEGVKIAEHTVPGPAIVHVLDGELDLVCLDETRVAHAGEMVVIPHDRPRSMSAKSDVTFLWTLGTLGIESDATPAERESR